MLSNQKATEVDQWQQKQLFLNELHQLSCLPITSSSNKKDEFKSRILDYIFEQSFDALHGGLIVNGFFPQSKKVLLYKPTATNIFICESLVAAALVFYEGEFLLIAEKILSMLCNRLNTERHYLLCDFLFTPDKFISNIEHKKIERILNHKEIELLEALTDNQPATHGAYLSIEFHHSLKNAAKKINMHYKQAQIIENTLLEKLSSNIVNKNSSKLSVVLTNALDTNCDLVIALTNFYLYSPHSHKLGFIENTYEEILRQVNQQEFNFFDLCSVVYSGIILLQLDFKLDKLHTILTMLTELNTLREKQELQKMESPKLIFQIAFISGFIAEARVLLDNKIPEEIGFIKPTSEKRFRFTFLNSKAVDLDKRLTEHRSKFDPNHFIFVIDPAYLT